MPPKAKFNDEVMTSTAKFSDGETVLCFHGPLLYDAKCIKSQVKEKSIKYFIHYKGWNNNWDEWVPEHRILKHNEANLQKQKELNIAHNKGGKLKNKAGNLKKEPIEKEVPVPVSEKRSKRKREAIKTPPPKPPSPPPPVLKESPPDPQKKKRTKLEQNVETEEAKQKKRKEEEYQKKVEIKIKLPEDMKHWLVDDWDIINRQKKLIKLPARVTVETILDEYVKSRLSQKGITKNKETGVREFARGVKEYFNAMCTKQLQFKFEKPQCIDIMANNPSKTPSEIYGAMHLVRMLTKVGQHIAYTALEEETVAMLSSHFHEFAKFILRCPSNPLSLNDYFVATPEYCRRTS